MKLDVLFWIISFGNNGLKKEKQCFSFFLHFIKQTNTHTNPHEGSMRIFFCVILLFLNYYNDPKNIFRTIEFKKSRSVIPYTLLADFLYLPGIWCLFREYTFHCFRGQFILFYNYRHSCLCKYSFSSSQIPLWKKIHHLLAMRSAAAAYGCCIQRLFLHNHPSLTWNGRP